MVRPIVLTHDDYVEPPVAPSEPTAGASAPPPPRRSGSLHDVRRSRHDRMLGGVAAGIARNYGWDVTLVRVAFVVASVFGIGIPVYVVAWIVIPPEPEGPESGGGTGPERREAGALIGLALLGIGVLLLGGRLVPDGDLTDLVWPLTLIGGGVAVLVMRSGARDQIPAAVASASAPTEPDTVSVGATATDEAADTAGAAPTSSAWDQTSSWAAWSPPTPPHAIHDRRGRRDRRTRPFLGPLTVSVALCFVGVVALLTSIDAISIDPEVAGAIALGILGAALVLSAWFGRARGLIFLAVPLAIGLGVVALIDTPLEGGVGDRDYRPETLAQLESEYRLAIGSMTIDLRDVPIHTGTTDVDASVAVGELVVLVPRDVTVEVHSEVGAGQVDVFGEDDNGTSVERDDVARAGPRVLQLDLRTGIGRTRVQRLSDAAGR
jgi:phage shock protein PspC (stress-responsive transcriptional regulator)